LIVTIDKIKNLDPTVTFTDDLLSKRQIVLNKLLFLLNEIDDISAPNDEIADSEPDDLGLKLNSMANLFGGEQIVESGDINPAVFDNFGSGLARLLGGGGLPIATSLRGSDAHPNDATTTIQQIHVQLPINENLKKNENLSFSIKKKFNGT
jgi:hypothetical protein